MTLIMTVRTVLMKIGGMASGTVSGTVIPTPAGHIQNVLTPSVPTATDLTKAASTVNLPTMALRLPAAATPTATMSTMNPTRIGTMIQRMRTDHMTIDTVLSNGASLQNPSTRHLPLSPVQSLATPPNLP